MTSEKDDIELIERYLSGTSNAAEKAEVERRKNSDPDFEELFSALGKVIAGIRYEARQKLRAELFSLEENISDKEKKSNPYLLAYWSAGIAAVIVIALGIFWLIGSTDPHPPSLFAEVFVPYTNVVRPTVRGAAAAHDTLSRAYAAYEAGDYPGAIALFRIAKSHDEGTELYLGISELAEGNTKEARAIFEGLRETSAVFDDQADYYIALTWLREGNKAECLRLLKIISSEKRSFAAQAAEAIAKIEVSPSAR